MARAPSGENRNQRRFEHFTQRSAAAMIALPHTMPMDAAHEAEIFWAANR